jgi:hypothetical protein
MHVWRFFFWRRGVLVRDTQILLGACFGFLMGSLEQL